MKYTISPQLLANIKKIAGITAELNGRRFSKVVLYELERTAREVSAHASTAIEGNPLPLTEVKKILKTQPKNLRQSEREVINYNTALKNLKNTAVFDEKLILAIHEQVTNQLLSPYQIGEFRVEPVVVNNPYTGKTVYLPPEEKEVEKLMRDLVDFVKNNQKIIDPLVLAGIFHRQFVIIHPFIDGNGRTARLLTKILLSQMGLDTFSLFSFENYYNQNVTRYFQTVGVFGNYYDIADQIDHTLWLEYFTEGIADELLRVHKILLNLTDQQTNITVSQQQILDYIEKYGQITDKNYAKITARAKATRVWDFNKLIKLGLIKRRGRGKNTYYK